MDRMSPRTLLWPTLLLLTALGPDTALGGGGLPARSPGSIRIRGNPDGFGAFRLVQAFPRLRFRKPLYIGQPPDGSNRLFVLEQDGLVKWFEKRRDVEQAYLALDIRRRVYTRHPEEGLLGLAFHPAFARNRSVFLHYSANRPRRGVVSRWQMNRAGTRFLPSSEQVVLQQSQPWGNHNGGGLEFGPDGFLYVTFGDGGSANDPLNSGQNLATWLGSILRIDVDHGSPYTVPRDNPFVHVPGARPEIWAYGLRNVWRFSFDRVTGDMWGGDVGQDRWEEVVLIRKGENHGWNVREGHAPFRPRRVRTKLVEPVVSLNRRIARSVTGGYVYRGKRLPGLLGAYVYADYETGNIWALRHDGEKLKENRLIARGSSISSFGEDRDGEIYFTSFDGRIYTFVQGRPPRPQDVFPKRLSDTGLFTDMRRLTPHPSLIPYSVNAPLWSDGAEKERFLMLPDMQRVRVDEQGEFHFPRGTIFVKTFYFGRPGRGAAKGERLETRLLILGDGGWAGYTYVWNEAQDEALLIDGRVERPLEPGKPTPTWTFPGRADCMSCHTEVAGRVLGFQREQLDRIHDYGGTRENQLDALTRVGVFDRAVPRRAWPDWDDPQADLGAQVRAYLDSNCANCHRPAGTGNAKIDLRAEVPLEQAHLVNEPPSQGHLGVPGATVLTPGRPEKSLLYLRMQRTDEKGMPNLAHNTPDTKALERIARWIKSME